MKMAVEKQTSYAIAYDSSRMDCPPVDFFSVDFWRSNNALAGEAVGRGSAWFLKTPIGKLVLRQYLRGGWAAKLSHRHYVYTGTSRTRPFREFQVLANLHELGLPVPVPVAALVKFGFLVYSGAILTETIPSTRTLADALVSDAFDPPLKESLWGRVGQCIRRFHKAGVWHADLNARNILLDPDNAVYLIDFDRARFTPGHAVQGRSNLDRLKRSLVKLCPPGKTNELELAWKYLMEAYHA